MNATIKQKHTRLGVELVRKLSKEGKRIFTIPDARRSASSCGIADSYILESLHHLSCVDRYFDSICFLVVVEKMVFYRGYYDFICSNLLLSLGHSSVE